MRGLTSLVRLDLRANQLETLPSVPQTTTLDALHLAENRLTAISPEALEAAPCLGVLDLRDNRLADLPQELGRLTGLHTLDLRNNDLRSLHYSIGYMPALSRVQLDGNPMRAMRKALHAQARRQSDAAARRLESLTERAGEIQDKLGQALKAAERTRETELKQLERPLGDLGRVRVWAHDLNPTPGAVYRYRTRVAVSNPVFRKESELATDDPAQVELANKIRLHSQWSAWSDPVRVEDRVTYRVTAASPPNEYGAGASATIELFALYYGHYRLLRLGIEPGETVDTQLSLPEWLVRFDLGRVDEKRLEDLIDDGLQIVGKPGALKAADNLTPQSPVTLLDVRVLPISEIGALGQETQPIEIVLREQDGKVRVVRPLDEEDAATAMLRLSSLQAETALLRTSQNQEIQQVQPRSTGSSGGGGPRIRTDDAPRRGP